MGLPDDPGLIIMRHFDINDAGEPKMDSMEQAEAASAAAAKNPDTRVKLDYLRGRIVGREFLHPQLAPHMTIAVLEVDNGFLIVGTSTPADPENFDPELGKKFATEDAERQLWRLLGFEMRSQLAKGA